MENGSEFIGNLKALCKKIEANIRLGVMDLTLKKLMADEKTIR